MHERSDMSRKTPDGPPLAETGEVRSAQIGAPADHPHAAGRLDKVLLLRGLAPSRARAAQLIAQRLVRVDGQVVVKASTSVSADQEVSLVRADEWVSRAAYKLLGALDSCPQVSVAGARCLDAGASTGGFTQVLLSRGAAHVVAADVGRDQMAKRVSEDPRVSVVEGLNLRYVEPGQLGPAFDVVVADLSFISLRLVLRPLRDQAAPGADILLMVKPQFEVGRQKLPKTGVVTSAQQRRDAVAGVIETAGELGLAANSVHRSAVTGQDGNAEFFVHFTAPHAGDTAPYAGETVGNASTSRLAPAVNAKLDGIDYS